MATQPCARIFDATIDEPDINKDNIRFFICWYLFVFYPDNYRESDQSDNRYGGCKPKESFYPNSLTGSANVGLFIL